MQEVLRSLLTVGLTAGWIVAVILVVRLFLKKAPRWITVCLWALVALRLLCPVSPESPVSVVPSAQMAHAVEAVLPTTAPRDPSGVTQAPTLPTAPTAPSTAPSELTVAAKPFPWTAVLLTGWAVGAVGLLVYAVISAAYLRWRMRDAVRLTGRIYQSDRTASPFVFGIVRPRIYLPYGLDTEERLLVQAHEEAHIRRGDHLWKPFGFVLLSVYWFQPLLWVAYVCLCHDIEAACDERVIRTLSADERKHYSYALLAVGRERRRITACPVAFGETGLKERVKRVKLYKKPAVWIVVAALLVATVAAVCLLTNRAAQEAPVQGTFRGAEIYIESDPYQTVPARKMTVAEATYEMLEDGTDELLRFRIDKVDTEEMAVTVGFSKPMWVDGVKTDSVTIPYDTDALKVRSENGDYIYTLKLRCPSSVARESIGDLLYPTMWEEGRASQTMYRGGELTLQLYTDYFVMNFGRLSDHEMVGTFTQTDDRLVLSEDAGVAVYTFLKENDGRLRYDAKASYRHKASKSLLLDDGTALEHLFRVEMDTTADTCVVEVLDWDGRVVLSNRDFFGRPVCELQSDSILRITGHIDEDTQYTRCHLYVDLNTMTALDTFDRVVSDNDADASASLVEEGGKYYVHVVQYEPGITCGTPPIPTRVDSKFRLYSVGDIAAANVRVWLEKYRLTVAYTNKVGDPVVTVYDWQTGDRVESTVHAVGGAVTADENAPVETVFTQGDRRLHYSGIARAFYHLGDGQYVDLLTALEDGMLTLDALAEELQADIESGALTVTGMDRNGTRYGSYDERDESQSVTLRATLDKDIYIGDKLAAGKHDTIEPLAFAAVCR